MFWDTIIAHLKLHLTRIFFYCTYIILISITMLKKHSRTREFNWGNEPGATGGQNENEDTIPLNRIERWQRTCIKMHKTLVKTAQQVNYYIAISSEVLIM